MAKTELTVTLICGLPERDDTDIGYNAHNRIIECTLHGSDRDSDDLLTLAKKYLTMSQTELNRRCPSWEQAGCSRHTWPKHRDSNKRFFHVVKTIVVTRKQETLWRYDLADTLEPEYADIDTQIAALSAHYVDGVVERIAALKDEKHELRRHLLYEQFLLETNLATSSLASADVLLELSKRQREAVRQTTEAALAELTTLH